MILLNLSLECIELKHLFIIFRLTLIFLSDILFILTFKELINEHFRTLEYSANIIYNQFISCNYTIYYGLYGLLKIHSSRTRIHTKNLR